MLNFAYLAIILTILHSLTLQTNASPLPFGPFTSKNHKDKYPQRTLAGIHVIDTPIVKAAQAYAKSECSASTYNHVNRSWLWSILIISHNKTLQSQNLDMEVLAVASLLHDLGTDRRPNSPHVTTYRRFEVDSAISARNFIRSHPDGKNWDEQRVQLVWDAIALHSESKYALWKELEVQVVWRGNEVEFSGGEKYGITVGEREAVLREFPDVSAGDQGPEGTGTGGVIEFVSWLCRTKPNTTYDTFMQPFGEMFV